jgi:hypothetical protein
MLAAQDCSKLQLHSAHFGLAGQIQQYCGVLYQHADDLRRSFRSKARGSFRIASQQASKEHRRLNRLERSAHKETNTRIGGLAAPVSQSPPVSSSSTDRNLEWAIAILLTVISNVTTV